MSWLDAHVLPGAQAAQPRGASQDCPLCGFCFSVGEASCSGCVFLGGCSMLKCPNCHYEFVAESKIVGWFQKFFRKGRHVEPG